MNFEIEKTGCLAILTPEGRAMMRRNEAIESLSRELASYRDQLEGLTGNPSILDGIKKTEEGVGPARITLQAATDEDGIHFTIDHRCESDNKYARSAKNWFVDHRRTILTVKDGSITEVDTGIFRDLVNIMDADQLKPTVKPVNDLKQQTDILEAFVYSVQTLKDPYHLDIRRVI